MSVPDLDLTVRLLGLPLHDLWGQYLAVGGSSTLQAFVRRISGEVSWPREEDLFLAVALSDALIDESLVSLDPLLEFVTDGGPSYGSPVDRRPAHRGERPPGEVGTLVPGGAVDLAQLIVRAQRARASARQVRHTAQEARRRVHEWTDHLVRAAQPTAALPDS